MTGIFVFVMNFKSEINSSSNAERFYNFFINYGAEIDEFTSKSISEWFTANPLAWDPYKKIYTEAGYS